MLFKETYAIGKVRYIWTQKKNKPAERRKTDEITGLKRLPSKNREEILELEKFIFCATRHQKIEVFCEDKLRSLTSRVTQL